MTTATPPPCPALAPASGSVADPRLGVESVSAEAPRPPIRHRTALAAAVTVTLWASAFVGARALGSSFSPGALAFGRITVGALALAIVTLRPGRPLPRGRSLAVTATYGVAWFAAYTVAFNAAAHHLDAGTLAMVVNVAPLLVALLAGALFREGFSRSLFVGIAIAFSGVVIISVGASGPSSVRPVAGLGLGLLAAVLYASGVLVQKVALRRVDVRMTTFLGCAAGAVVLLPFAPRFVAEVAAAPGGAVVVLVYLGLFPTAVAFSTWTYALARSDAGRLTAVTLTTPAIVVLLSWLLLGELPTLAGVVGGGLCLLGVGISRRRRSGAVAATSWPSGSRRARH
jgi:drug/metabolite transporter (DMT)-like permease